MTSISATALSGLDAARTRVAVSANNVANVATEGFTAQRVELSTRQGGGVTGSIRDTGQGVSLVAEAVEQRAAVYAFKAGVAVVKADNAMIGSLFDRRA
jgi:flagellar hook protein FlgE